MKLHPDRAMQLIRERPFNVPAIILVVGGIIGLIHAVFVLLLTQRESTAALFVLAFIPARYNLTVLANVPWIVGWGPAVWTFVTYALLHADLNHLFFNLVWLLAFGTPIARRFGALRFLAFFAATAAAGAAVHLVLHFGEIAPLVGASAAISGAMAATMRFAFQRRGPLGLLGSRDPEAFRVPAALLGTMLRDTRVLAFLLVWFGLNFLFGMGTLPMPGVEQNVAWEAHVGGFLAGLLAFAAFDPIRKETVSADQESAPREPTNH
jgi:membrane associated rhomboid family serine protease